MEKILSIIKAIPGAIILIYAYIYLLGYIYLSSYFREWELSSLELGFSIADYATVALYPLMVLISTASFMFLLGYFSPLARYLALDWKRVKLRLVPLPIGSAALIAILKILDRNFDVLFSSTIFFGWLFGFYFGIVLRCFLIKKNILTRILVFMFPVILIISSPIFSISLGKRNAREYLVYSIIPFGGFKKLSKVKIVTINPIEELEHFKVGKNEYEGLSHLVYKNDIYYYVFDKFEQEKVKEKMSGKIEELTRINLNFTSELEDLKNIIDESNSEMLTSFIHKLQT